MSLDLSIIQNGICVFDTNITHNLAEMARVAGVYIPMWTPNYYGKIKCKDIIPLLKMGIRYMKKNKVLLREYNPPNGWGDYDVLLTVLIDYYKACKMYKNCRIIASC